MKPISNITLLFLFFLSILKINAQEFTIAAAHLQSDYNISEKVDNQIKAKMVRALTKYGVGNSNNAIFALVPKISILSENTVPGIPPISEMEYVVSFDLTNIFDGNIFASYPITVKSKGSNKENAISLGFKSISLDMKEFSDFLENNKAKVINHYEKELPKVLQRANNSINVKNFEEALLTLAQVPQEIPSYNKVLTMIERCYKMYEETEAKRLLQKARAIWSTNKEDSSANEVAELIGAMPVYTSSSKDAMALLNEINQFAADKERYKRVREQMESKRNHLETMERINAARAIGVAYGMNSGRRTNIILWR